MIKRTFFLFFFYFGVIFVCVIFLPALIFPQKITIYGGKILGFWSKFCLEIFLSTKVVIKGKEKILNNQKFFIASAHQSQFETFFLQSIFNSPVFILKKELLKIPIFGWHLKKINSIAIEREIITKENLGFFEKIINVVNKTKRPLIIFPQGTRTPSEMKKPFKKGVGRIYENLQIKCLPIALNSGKVWPKEGNLITNGKITISILQPIAPGVSKEIFLQDLEEKIYKEIDKIN